MLTIQREQQKPHHINNSLPRKKVLNKQLGNFNFQRTIETSATNGTRAINASNM